MTITAAHVDGFQAHRPLLIGLAYRLLGSMWDAEDAVQDAFVRWRGGGRRRHPRGEGVPDHDGVADLPRQAQCRAADPRAVHRAVAPRTDRVRRPRTGGGERAVFVLREAFDVPYVDIAEVVATSEADCRQLLCRARRKLGQAAPVRPSNPDQQRLLLDQFLAASRAGTSPS